MIAGTQEDRERQIYECLQEDPRSWSVEMRPKQRGQEEVVTVEAECTSHYLLGIIFRSTHLSDSYFPLSSEDDGGGNA